MDMTAVLDGMVPGSPQSPDVREKSVLEEPPDVQAKRRVNKRPRAQRCITRDFDKEKSRSPSPPPQLMLSPRALRPVKLPGLDSDDKGKGPAEEMEAGRASPRKILRLQMQRKRQATMNGGSSAHNTAAKIERGVSFCLAPHEETVLVSVPDEIDPETLFEGSDLQELYSPRSPCLDVGALTKVKLNFEDLQMYDKIEEA